MSEEVGDDMGEVGECEWGGWGGGVVFFFNDTATTEIYTPFPTRRSSDLTDWSGGGAGRRLNQEAGVSARATGGSWRFYYKKEIGRAHV